jgi:hypothetical protein
MMTNDVFDATAVKMHSLLLDLPLELLFQVLEHTDPDTFSMVLLTCKELRNRILKSKALLRRQLSHLPGWCNIANDEWWTSNATADDYLKVFTATSRDVLATNAAVMCDIATWTTDIQRNSKNSIIKPCADGASCTEPHLIFAIASTHDGKICIYNIVLGEVSLAHFIDPPVCENGTIPIVCGMAFRDRSDPDSGCLYDLVVLYRMGPHKYTGKRSDRGHDDMRVILYKFREGVINPTIRALVNFKSLRLYRSSISISISPEGSTIVIPPCSLLSSCIIIQRRVPSLYEPEARSTPRRDVSEDEASGTREMYESDASIYEHDYSAVTWRYHQPCWLDLLPAMPICPPLSLTVVKWYSEEQFSVHSIRNPTRGVKIYKSSSTWMRMPMHYPPIAEEDGIFNRIAIGTILDDRHDCDVGIDDKDGEGGDDSDGYCLNTVGNLFLTQSSRLGPYY